MNEKNFEKFGKKIGILGTGAMATAIAKMLYDSGQTNIHMYGIDEKEISDLKNGMNTKYFQDTKLPSFQTSNNLEEVISNAEYIVVAVPSQVISSLLEKCKGYIKNNIAKTMIINVSKGFYPNSHISIHEGVEKLFKGIKTIKGVVSLIGPSFAREIVLEYPTTISAVTRKKAHAEEVAKLMSNDYIRIYIQTDVIGAEVGAAYKNILALASGICDGLGYEMNTRAAILTRGVAEMVKFNKYMGGKKETLYGLTGVGDLILTASSTQSRNYSFGKKFVVEGPEVVKANKITVEGLEALKVVYQIGKENKLDLPIAYALYDSIFIEKPIKNVIHNLWERDFKQE